MPAVPHRGRKPLVIVTRKLPDAVEVRLKELFDTRLNASDRPFTQAELIEAVRHCDVLVPTVTDRIDATVIAEAGPQLGLIASFGNGIDHLDLEAAKARNILVSNTPEVLTEDTADMVLALILAVMRRLGEGQALVQGGQWQGWGPVTMLGSRVRGKRLGIIGLGRIGRAVAARARAFGMAVHYHSRNRVDAETEASLEATWWDSLDQMLAHMDIVSVNCPLTPATHHLLNAERLARMRPTAILINTARGGIVDEATLAQRLVNGQLGGAGLDVFEREPMVTPALMGLPNVVLTPHISSATVEARNQMGERILINIRAHMDGHKPPDWVIAELAQ